MVETAQAALVEKFGFDCLFSPSWSKYAWVTWFWHFQASDFHETFTESSLALNMSRKRKLLTDPFFPWNFDLFFIDYGHIYVPNRLLWDSTSRPHIGHLVMNLFLSLVSTVRD